MFKKKLVTSLVALSICLMTVSIQGNKDVSAATASDATYASQFSSLTLAKGYKDLTQANPVMTQRFTADPGEMEYNGRVYMYSTNDDYIYDSTGAVTGNTFANIQKINCMSSSDMVNWTDHGKINVAGSNGAAKWAGCSWAPAAAHKIINGKEKFFLYFANNGSGIGVLTSDSPTGPWTDPLGKELIAPSTENCSNVIWLFDPSVLVDTDGTGYLYFGGGVPTGQGANPKTARVVKLGTDMISLAGTPVVIDAPYMFEDSGINKIGSTYYYSYCTNWSTRANTTDPAAATISYMTSSSPTGPFTYQGTILDNPGKFFGYYGTNHHSILQFNNKFYIFYHSQWLENKMGTNLGYRNVHVDEINVSNGKISPATGTLTGPAQVKDLDPYTSNTMSTIAWQGGINVIGSGNTKVEMTAGDWVGVSNVAFGTTGANSITIKAASNAAVIKVCVDSPSNAASGYIYMPSTGSATTFADVSVDISSITGTKKLFFVSSGDCTIDSWQFSTSSVSGTTPVTTPNLLNTYGKLFGKVGNAIPASKMLDSTIMNDAKKQYNSVTAENEMKPDYILGSSATLISVSEAKALGYYIPANYTESTVPKLNFTTVDKMLQACYENGLTMRGHTLVWHAQTPAWYFKSAYAASGSYVSQSVMNTRMEFYIKSVMNHVSSSQYGSVVYAWDVVNEYLHSGGSGSGWQQVYGDNLGTTAGFVKSAFKYAYESLSASGLTDKVKLFYNDFNEYMEVDNIIKLINFINADGKICAGIGMQSHLSTTFPSVDYYKAALQAFAKAGFEIQITELDAGATSFTEQAKYYYDLMTAILSVKKSGGNISAIVWWGLCDDYSWRTDKPLLFSSYLTPKEAYTSVLQAYFDAGYTVDTPITPVTMGDTVALSDGWYYIKNVNANKDLQVATNIGKASQNVEIGTALGYTGQKWYLTNMGSGYVTLKSGLGKYMLDVSNAADTDGTNIQIYNAYSNDPQKFSIKSSPTSGAYAIATMASKQTKVLDVYNFGTTDGTNVCQWTYTGKNNQLWNFESTSGPSLVGDVNGDAQINIADYILIKRYIASSLKDFPNVDDDIWAGDVNGDGIIDNNDCVLLKNNILKR